MGFIPRRRIKENLAEVDVFIDDIDNSIFKVFEVPDTVVQGRSAFKIFGSNLLRSDTPLKIEILDKAGTPVWTQPVIYGQDGSPKLPYRYITIEVYPPPINIPGEAELVILGELAVNTFLGGSVPDEFKETYNVRYRKFINIDTEKTINEQPILFYKKPEVVATEFVSAQKLTNAPVTRFISGSELGGSVNSDIKGNTFVSNSFSNTQTKINDKSESPAGDLASQANLWKYKTGLYKENKVLKRRGLKQEKSSPEKPQMSIRSKSDKFISKMVGSDITIKNITLPTASAVELSGLDPAVVSIEEIYNAFTFPDFTGKVQDVRSDKELILNKPYAVEFIDPTSADKTPKKIFTDIADDNAESFADFTASYTDWEVPITSSYRFDSFIDFTIEDMRTFSGDVYRVKISGGSDSSQGDFPVLLDTVVDAPELLVDTISPSGVLRSGYFIDQDHIDKYWNTFGGNNNTNQLSANYTMSLADGIYLSGSYEAFNQVGRVDLDNTYSFTIKKDVSYTIAFNAKGRKASKDDIDGTSYESARMFLHLSGSNLKDFSESDIEHKSSFGNTITNEFGQPVGLEIGENDPIETFKDFGIVSHTFTPNFKLDRVKNTDTIVQIRIHSGEWIISDLSLKPATSTGFSPDEFKCRVPIPPNTLRPDNFDFLIEYLDINGKTAETLTFLDNVPISGSALILEGTDNLLTGSLFMGSKAGEGIESAGANSAFIRSVGYKGFLSASNATGVNSGFMMFSGSVLPDESDDYKGVGLEMVANSASYFKFRSDPSELDIRADAFFIGNEDSAFVSGSQGNIEISSSKFHLSPDGDVVMNNITASNANLSGKITATSGDIGGFKVEGGQLSSGVGVNSVTMSGDLGLIAMGTGSSFNKSSMAGGLRMGFDTDGQFKFALGSAGSFIHFDSSGVSIKSDSFDVTASVADINVDQFGLTSTNLVISSSGQFIAAGSTVPSGVDGTNKGFFVSAEDNQLLIGDAAGGHFIFDGTDVSISSSAFFLGNADNFISGSNTNFELFSSGTTTLSGSEVRIETPKFYMGEESQYISGSEGNIEISSSNFHLQADGDVVMSGQITATAGAIGGFEIDTDQINSSNDNIILKSSGQITASAIQLTGEVNIIGGSAKGQLDTLGAETASIKARTASFESSVISIGAKTSSFAGSIVLIGQKTSSIDENVIKLAIATGSLQAATASFELSIGKLGVATSSIAGNVTASKAAALVTSSLFNVSSIASSSLIAAGSVVSASFIAAGSIISGSVISKDLAVGAMTSGSAKTGSFESSVTSLGAKTASFQSSVTILGQKTASLATGITAAGVGAQASSSAVQLLKEASDAVFSSSLSIIGTKTASLADGITKVGASGVASASLFSISSVASSSLISAGSVSSASLFSISSVASSSLIAAGSVVSSSFIAAGSIISGSVISTNISAGSIISGSVISTNIAVGSVKSGSIVTDKLAIATGSLQEASASLKLNVISLAVQTGSLLAATASLAVGITAAGVGAQASSSAVQLLKEASDAVFSSSFSVMGERTASLGIGAARATASIDGSGNVTANLTGTVGGTANATVLSGAAKGEAAIDGSGNVTANQTGTIGGVANATVRSGAARGQAAIDGSGNVTANLTGTIGGTANADVRSGAAKGEAAIDGSGIVTAAVSGNLTGTIGGVANATALTAVSRANAAIDGDNKIVGDLKAGTATIGGIAVNTVRDRAITAVSDYIVYSDTAAAGSSSGDGASVLPTYIQTGAAANNVGNNKNKVVCVYKHDVNNLFLSLTCLLKQSADTAASALRCRLGFGITDITADAGYAAFASSNQPLGDVSVTHLLASDYGSTFINQTLNLTKLTTLQIDSADLVDGRLYQLTVSLRGGVNAARDAVVTVSMLAPTITATGVDL